MATGTKKRKFTGTKKRFIGKPSGQIQERVQAIGPERFSVPLPSDPAVGQRYPCESDSIPYEQGLVGDKHRLGLPASLGKRKASTHYESRL